MKIRWFIFALIASIFCPKKFIFFFFFFFFDCPPATPSSCAHDYTMENLVSIKENLLCNILNTWEIMWINIAGQIARPHYWKKNLTRRRNRSIFYFGSGKNYAEWNIKILWSFQVCFDFLTLFHKFYRRLSPQKNYWFYKKMSYVMFIQKHYSRTSFIFILNIFC